MPEVAPFNVLSTKFATFPVAHTNEGTVLRRRVQSLHQCLTSTPFLSVALAWVMQQAALPLMSMRAALTCIQHSTCGANPHTSPVSPIDSMGPLTHCLTVSPIDSVGGMGRAHASHMHRPAASLSTGAAAGLQVYSRSCDGGTCYSIAMEKRQLATRHVYSCCTAPIVSL